MTDFKLLQQALDALEFPHDSEWSNKAKTIEALQHALAQPEQAFVPFPSFMRKRIEQAMEDAINPKGMSVHDGKANVLASDLHRMLLVIDSVLAQPEQEPVAKHICNLWINPETSFYEVDRCTHPINEVFPVYAAPPRKPWVGLTDDEKESVYKHADAENHQLSKVVSAVEWLLKNKNTT